MSGLRVLFVGQGHTFNRVSRAIRQAGHEVLEQTGAEGEGLDALAVSQGLPPDLVILPGEMASGLIRERERLRKTVAKLEEALESRKVIERAKGLLMEQQGLKESEAYARMRQLAMDKRKSIREIAEVIIGLADLVPDTRRTVE